jgi:hypothetical protein
MSGWTSVTVFSRLHPAVEIIHDFGTTESSETSRIKHDERIIRDTVRNFQAHHT